MINRKPRSVVWAVTPYDEERLKTQESAAKAINVLFDEEVVIQPAYVWDTRMAEIAEALDFVKERNSVIFSRWEKPELKGKLLNLRIIEARGGHTEQARALVGYAKKTGASLIVASHHMRTGMKKWFQGSFCESLSLVSDIPLLIVPPQWKAASKKNAVLVPTDFSPASTAAFEEVLKVAKQCRLGITLYHRAEFPIFVGSDFLYSASQEFYRIEKETLRENKAKILAMAKRARSLGISAKVVFDKNRGGRATDAILAEAKRGYALIAMAAHNGPMSRILLGSTSRGVLRESPCPVWVVRPREANKMKKTAKSPKVRKSSSLPKLSELDNYLA